MAPATGMLSICLPLFDEKTERLATAVCLYGVFGCEGESRHIYIDISLLLFFLQLPHMSNSPAG